MENAIKTFTELAKISGLSGNEIEVANYIRSYLEPLGFRINETDKEKFPTGNCGNIIAQYGNGGEVALCAHMDTATDTGNVNVIVEDGIIKSDGKQQLGADCRLGVTVLLEAAKGVIEENPNIQGITLLAASVTDDTTRQRNRNKKQKKQTILTGYKRTGNDIHNRQRVSRHSLPTLLYFLFSPPHIFFNSILCQCTNGTLAFAPTAQANPQAKAKEPFFANAPMRLLKII